MSKYIPKYDKDDRDLLILDNLFAVNDCVEYASRHRMNVLFTETTSTSSVAAMMAFKKKGYDMDMYEKKSYAPDGIELEPKVYVLFTFKENVENVNKQRLITLTDGTSMGDTIIVFSTNAPTEELKELERVSNDVYHNGGDIDYVPIWAEVLTKKGYVFEFIDECQHVTPFCNSTDWLEEKYSNVKEHYIINNQSI